MEPREPADLVLSASWIVPVEPDGCVLEGHALAVRDGSIAALGPAAEVDTKFSPRERLHLDGQALVPGFVKRPHPRRDDPVPGSRRRPSARNLARRAHLAGRGPFRGRAVRARRDAPRRGGDVEWRNHLFNDMYFFPDVAGEGRPRAGIRAVLGLIVLEVPTRGPGTPRRTSPAGLEVHEAFRPTAS